jgi:hypothetical protein
MIFCKTKNNFTVEYALRGFLKSHYMRLGEIGEIDLKRERVKKGGERIRITLKDTEVRSNPD